MTKKVWNGLLVTTALAGCAHVNKKESIQANNHRAPSVQAMRDWKVETHDLLNLLKTDLVANHPAAVDENKSSSFSFWLDRGFSEASQMANQAESFADLYYTLKYYSTGFRDYHLSVTPTSADTLQSIHYRWPGFTVGLRGKNLQVVSSDKGHEYLVGRIIQTCDGKDPKRSAKNSLLNFFGNQAVSSSLRTWIPRFFVDQQNKFLTLPKTCTLAGTGTPKTIDLIWSEIKFEEMWPHLVVAQYGAKPSPELSKVNSKLIWLSLPTFLPNDSTATLYEGFLEKLSATEDATIVFDLRGNTGGNSKWVELFVARALGEDWLKYLKRFESPKGSFFRYRASTDNLLRIRELAKQQSPTGTGYFSQIATGMEKAIENKRPYFDWYPLSERAAKPKTALKSIVAVTDGFCSSSCLVMIDLLRKYPKFRHLGLATDADTHFLQTKETILEKYGLRLSLPIMEFVGRKRPDNIGYIPDKEFRGDIGDTVKLKEWLEKQI